MRYEAKEFQTLLQYDEKRNLVGVKFIYSKEEYETISIKEATHQMFFCMMVKAATVGHKLKATREQLYCSAAREVLGFSKIKDNTLSGEVLHKRNMYESKEIARKVVEETPYLDHDIYGMIVQPLSSYKEEPDVVLSFCKPYTAMRIIQGYSYKYGVAKNIKIAGMGGVCTELMARAYKDRDMNISFLCSGTRFSAEWKDNEVGISFPYEVFLQVLDGIKKTMNTFEPDDKKREIIERANKNEINIDIDMGSNYYDSCLGVAKKGIEGYHPKKLKGKVYERKL